MLFLCERSERLPAWQVLFGGHFFGFAFLAHHFEFAFCGLERRIDFRFIRCARPTIVLACSIVLHKKRGEFGQHFVEDILRNAFEFPRVASV